MSDDELNDPDDVRSGPGPSALCERLVGMFDDFGWPYERNGPLTLRTHLGGENGTFVALVRVTEHWVVATINPFCARPEGGFGPVALKLMAGANHLANMAKVGIDPVGDAFLTVELPSEGFADSHLYDALAALTHYADQFTIPLLQANRIDRLNGGH